MVAWLERRVEVGGDKDGMVDSLSLPRYLAATDKLISRLRTYAAGHREM